MTERIVVPMEPARRPIVVSPRIALGSDLMDRARIAGELGVDQIWLEQLPDQRDATIVASFFLQAAPAAAVGTAILPVYTRHPLSAAQAALTLSDLSGGRFILGLGLSHHYVNEFVLGYQQGRPIAVMREYVRIVKGLIDEGSTNSEGEYFTARGRYNSARNPVPLFLAALQPQMIRLAVRYCDGILLWMCTPRFVAERVTPVVQEACAKFGKDPKRFQVMALLPAYAAADTSAAYEQASQQFRAYRLIPYYRQVLEAFGEIDVQQLCLFGTKNQIQDRMAAFREAGCTPAISPFGNTLAEYAETIASAFDP